MRNAGLRLLGACLTHLMENADLAHLSVDFAHLKRSLSMDVMLLKRDVGLSRLSVGHTLLKWGVSLGPFLGLRRLALTF